MPWRKGCSYQDCTHFPECNLEKQPRPCSCLYLAQFGGQVLDSAYLDSDPTSSVHTLCVVMQITLLPSFIFYIYKMAIITVGPTWDRIAPDTWKAHRILSLSSRPVYSHGSHTNLNVRPDSHWSRPLKPVQACQIYVNSLINCHQDL